MTTRWAIGSFGDRGRPKPLPALGQHLSAGGLDPAFAIPSDDVRPAIAAAGIDAETFPLGRPDDAGAGLTGTELAARLQRPAWQKKWLWRVLIENARLRIGPVRDAIARFAPDVVVSDAMAYDGAIAATVDGAAWASVATGLQSMADTRAYDALAQQRDALVREFGVDLAFRGSDALSPRLNLALVAPCLVPPPAPPDTVFTGSILPLRRRGDETEFPWQDLPPDRPIVIVSFGSHLSPPLAISQQVIDSAIAADAFAIVSAKDQDALQIARPGVLARRYLPQLELLPRASLLVCHGGANSVMEALAHGVPVCVLPLAYDQPLIGEMVERAGVGAMLRIDHAAGWPALIARLLRADAPERLAARAVAEQMRDGPALACRLISELATAR